MNKFFTVMEQMYPPPNKGNRYRLVENVETIDGVRSRLTNECSDDLQMVKDWADGYAKRKQP